MEIDYDPAKDVLNMRKHGVRLGDAARFEWETAHVEEDDRFDYGEQRFKATGYIGQRLYTLIFCMRGEVTRIISLRRTDPREYRRYANPQT